MEEPFPFVSPIQGALTHMLLNGLSLSKVNGMVAINRLNGLLGVQRTRWGGMSILL